MVAQPQGSVGRNLFEGGFLGLDNIGVFDRSAPLPTGGYLEQADGTAWMALFSQNMLEIAIELAQTDSEYGEMVIKFLEHFLWIASSMIHLGGDTGMWDEEDGFFYDVLQLAQWPGPTPQGSIHGRSSALVCCHGLRGGNDGTLSGPPRAASSGSLSAGPR